MTWGSWLWIIWLLQFAVFESIGLSRCRGSITLTYFIEQHFRPWFLVPFFSWLIYHFLFAKPAKK